MNKICTSIEQSKKLIELGIDVYTADMYYSFDYNFKEYEEDAQIIPKSEFDEHFSLFPEDIPTWSLSALLKLIKPINENTYKIIGTLDGGAIISFEEVTSVMFQEDNLIDASFEMVCWLKENKKI